MRHDHHDHHHGVDHGAAGRRALIGAVAANGLLLVVQVVVALSIGSLSLLADSLHNAGDVVALGVALAGMVLSTRPPTPRRTYGMARAEVLAALLNATVLVAVTGWVVVTAVGRLGDAPEITPVPLAVMGAVGMVVNGASAWWVARAGGGLGHRAAFWHLAADALGSLGVLVAAVAIAVADLRWADPVASLLISALVLVGVVRLLRETVEVLLESTPRHLDADAVAAALADLPGVVGVHHLHLWSIDSATTALTAHLDVGEARLLHDAQVVADDARHMLAERYGIGHATFELECHPCEVETH